MKHKAKTWQEDQEEVNDVQDNAHDLAFCVDWKAGGERLSTVNDDLKHSSIIIAKYMQDKTEMTGS